MRLNERFQTPSFNYSLERVLVMELKVARDHGGKTYYQIFPVFEIALVVGLFILLNKHLSEAHYAPDAREEW